MITYEEIKVEYTLRVAGATLLTADEAQDLPKHLRRHDRWWWLKPGFQWGRWSIDNVHSHGQYVDYIGHLSMYQLKDYGFVRPALILVDPDTSGLNIGSRFIFGNKEFEVISDDLAFCTTDIGTYPYKITREFDDLSYENSDIKNYIDQWYNTSLNKSAA